MGDEIVAESDDPRLRSICWWWSGGAYVDIGLQGSGPVDVVNVWDYEQGAAVIEFTPEALAAHLGMIYGDRDEIEAVRQAIAHG